MAAAGNGGPEQTLAMNPPGRHPAGLHFPLDINHIERRFCRGESLLTPDPTPEQTSITLEGNRE
jgi:hypothetical protein